MSILNNNPSNIYKILKERIPTIKNKNKDFMNELHNFKMSEEFWWAISGEYAILAEYTIILSKQDPRYLNELKNITTKFPIMKKLSSSIINLIGKDLIFGEKLNLNYANIKLSAEQLLIDYEDEHFINETEINTEIKQELALRHFTGLLKKLRLKKFKYFYIKLIKKITSVYQKKDWDKIIFNNNTDKDFKLILNLLLPDEINKYFPKWFSRLSNYIVKDKHKWKTYFGFERDIYQIILMAKSFEKYGDKNIKLISHGAFINITIWHLYRFSLFPNTKLIYKDKNLNYLRNSKNNTNNDILFCPPQLPWVSDFFSPIHFKEFMNVYRGAIKLLNDGLRNNKKIKIRYKNFKYLSGYIGPHTKEECGIPIENELFEDIVLKYKLVVSMPFSTISEKCYQNNISCLTYNYPYILTSKKSYLNVNRYPGVFSDSKKFLDELEKKIKEI